MVKDFFHGSRKIIERPVFGEGNPRNDYGLGFYCTESRDLAREWASSEPSDGFANHYRINLDGLSVLNLSGPEYNILHWLAILLENRIFDLRTPVAVQGRKYLLSHFLPDYKKADLIIGYRADDSYFSFARAFLENGISLEQLRRAMQLGNLGEQIVLHSQQAFDRLHFIEAEPVDSSVYFPRKQWRDRQAREAYFRMLEETPLEGAVYLVDILTENWNSDDPRI